MAFPSVPGTSLSSLPLELVGHIFSWIPRQSPDRMNFLSCCKACRQAPNIQAQFRRLGVAAAQLISDSNSSENPFLCFPHAGQLKKLALYRGQPEEAAEDPLALGSKLLQVLQPEGVQERSRVMAVLRHVEELHLYQGFPLFASPAAVGTAFGLYAQLRTIKIDARSCDMGPFLMAFAAPNGKCGLQELHISFGIFDCGGPSPMQIQSSEAVGNLRSLHTLSMSFFWLKKYEYMISPISSLTQLKSLTMTYIDPDLVYDSGEVQNMLWSLPSLQYLSLPKLPNVSDLEQAGSIQTIETLILNGFNHVEDVDYALDDIAQYIDSWSALKTICFEYLDLEQGDPAGFPDLGRNLSALSHIHIITCKIGNVQNFNDLLSCARFFKGIEHIRFESLESLPVGWQAELEHLCPTLTCLEFECSIDTDFGRFYDARQLSSLSQLHLSTGDDLRTYPGDVSRNAHRLLALAVAMSAKKGQPMTIFVTPLIVHERDRHHVEEEFNQLQLQWASVSNSLKSDHRQNCDVFLRLLL